MRCGVSEISSTIVQNNKVILNYCLNCDTCLSDEDLNRLQHKEFTQNEHAILYGQLDGSITGFIKLAPLASQTNSNKRKNTEPKSGGQHSL